MRWNNKNSNNLKNYLIHAESCECIVGGTEFFESSPTQTVVEGRKKLDFLPVANVTDLGQLEFLVKSADDDYYDSNEHCLELKIKIVKRNVGADIVAADKIGLSTTSFILFSRKMISISLDS